MQLDEHWTAEILDSFIFLKTFNKSQSLQNYVEISVM